MRDCVSDQLIRPGGVDDAAIDHGGDALHGCEQDQPHTPGLAGFDDYFPAREVSARDTAPHASKDAAAAGVSR